VWLVICVTFTIYIRAGKDIFKKRRQLQNFSSADAGTVVDTTTLETQASKVTEIRITSEAADTVPKDTEQVSSDIKGSRRGSSTNPYSFYSVTVESGQGYEGITIPMKQMETRTAPVPTTPRRPAKNEANAAAWVYCKYAMLYFVALLVTWVRPSPHYPPANIGEDMMLIDMCVWG
jgi:hypothetical protein